MSSLYWVFLRNEEDKPSGQITCFLPSYQDTRLPNCDTTSQEKGLDSFAKELNIKFASASGAGGRISFLNENEDPFFFEDQWTWELQLVLLNSYTERLMAKWL